MRASVSCGKGARSIGAGLVVFAGVEKGDSEKNAEALARKILQMRIFPDEEGKMSRSVAEAGGEILAVSQFTLCADLSAGRRPDFGPAAAPEVARPIYEKFVEALRASGRKVETGWFGEKMAVEIFNDGPVTFILENR